MLYFSKLDLPTYLHVQFFDEPNPSTQGQVDRFPDIHQARTSADGLVGTFFDT